MRSKEPATTKERLLSEARDVFLEMGEAAFSLREVARRSGVTAAAVYRHFDGKEALLAAVCAEGFRVFGSYLMQALGEKKPFERLRATGAKYLEFALERPQDYRVIFMRDVHAGPLVSPDSSFQFLVDRVRECIAAKALRDDVPEALAVTIWSHVHGLASLRLAGHLEPVGDEKAFRAFFLASTDDLLAGLAP